ncbi:DNA translocase FtsK [Planococcus kocurii]|uniref:DNA translocase FtsK n=1 Tax=Planococcus kocurii TaxID=1374 RepID=UPI003CFC7791
MSWIKNVWNRMFTDDAEEFEEQEEIIYETPPTVKKEKAPFRFPLIPDEEKEGFIHDVKRAEPRQEKPFFNGRERETPRKEPVFPIEKKVMGPKEAPIRQSTIANRKNAELPVNKTHRFEPTRIASPIHGFNTARPAPTQKLEEDREEKINRQLLDEAIEEKARSGWHKPKAPIEHEIAPIFEKKEEPIIEVAKAVETTESIEESVVINVSEEEPAEVSVVEEKQDERIVPPFSPINTAPVAAATEENNESETISEPTIELSAVTELKIDEEQSESAMATELPAQEQEPATEAMSTPAPKREKTVPFNVLMLKSDKELLKNKTKPLPDVPPHDEQLVTTPQSEKKTINLVDQPSHAFNSVSEAESQAYQLPLLEYLMAPENDRKDDVWMDEQGIRLIEALSHFQIKAEILSIVQGPAVTQFELKVAQGIKVSKIRNLADDLKLALAARDIRIQAPIPGKSSIGIEIPNRTSRAVRISEIIGSAVFEESDSPLEAALGLDLTGKPVTLDLRKMPHGLIAGATGSGKSVCINSLLVSLLYKSSPRDLKLLLIDPKMVELAPYNHIPHLVSPVITDVKAATASLKWAVEEMERRYQLFAHSGVRDISRYNKLVKEKGDYVQHLPYILIVIDELADLMMMSPSDVEDSICRIAQKARACGIHLVIATQRPSVDVITGLIKSNIPTRIAFSVSSQVDSRTILDSQGAERLLGRGDMLYLGNGMSAPNRLQGTFVTDDEIEKVIEHVRLQGKPEYFFREEELIKRSESPAEQDDLFEEACRFIMTQGSASTSLLQRKFHIGYNRAARLMDLIEKHGFISEQNGSKARSVLITENDIEEVFR